jgi:hypothetical protein
VAVVMAFGAASVFAESRPEWETRERAEWRSSQRDVFQHRGRVSRVERHGSGYHVFVTGARYPFHVPSAHYRRDRFRVGVVIDIGGYYNRRGWYDYYDAGYSRGGLRGVVERVDHRGERFVVRDDNSGRFITVVNTDRRRVRRGDYVEVYGDWSRRGLFRAWEVDVLDRYRSRR